MLVGVIDARGLLVRVLVLLLVDGWVLLAAVIVEVGAVPKVPGAGGISANTSMTKRCFLFFNAVVRGEGEGEGGDGVRISASISVSVRT